VTCFLEGDPKALKVEDRALGGGIKEECFSFPFCGDGRNLMLLDRPL
jgi:hypothetical protein